MRVIDIIKDIFLDLLESNTRSVESCADRVIRDKNQSEKNKVKAREAKDDMKNKREILKQLRDY